MRYRAFLLMCLICGALLPIEGARAQVSDTEVKAAFLPRFARYVTWPAASAASGNGPMTICVIGDDPFGSMLNKSVASQQVDGRGFVVRRLASVAGASDCAIAYVDGVHTAQSLAALSRQPTLTVTDASSGPQHGMIHFAVVDGRVRFSIDNAQAQARGLSISSRLLALATRVNQK